MTTMTIPAFNGEKLKALRDAKGITVRKLSAHLWVETGRFLTYQAIASHERGNTLPNANMLAAYSTFFKQPMEYFFDAQQSK